MPATIQVTLRGLVATFVKEKTCSVGLLGQTPANHELKITIEKVDAGGISMPHSEIEGDDVGEELKLEVKKVSKTGISLRKANANIDRQKDPGSQDPDSYLWIPDFERDFHNKPVGALKAGFRSILELENGELLTRVVSKNKLKVQKPLNPWHVFGHVAVETGFNVDLDQPESVAVFTNGREEVFRADHNTSYKILIDRGTTSHQHANDADFYYTALGHLIPKEERMLFSSTPLPHHVNEPLATNSHDVSILSTPDAVCFTGGGGGSTPS